MNLYFEKIQDKSETRLGRSPIDKSSRHWDILYVYIILITQNTFLVVSVPRLHKPKCSLYLADKADQRSSGGLNNSMRDGLYKQI